MNHEAEDAHATTKARFTDGNVTPDEGHPGSAPGARAGDEGLRAARDGRAAASGSAGADEQQPTSDWIGDWELETPDDAPGHVETGARPADDGNRITPGSQVENDVDGGRERRPDSHLREDESRAAHVTGRDGRAAGGRSRERESQAVGDWGEPGLGAENGRLSKDQRRRQLVGIGLLLLTTTPIHEMSLDQVAAEAGISRSLLFHYFPTKRDFYAAVVRAASRRILRAVDEAIAADPRPVYGLVDGLLTFIERRRDPYVAFVRGASGGDAWVLEIYEETRSRLADRTLTAMAGDFEDADPLLRMAVRGWLALAEEMILEWTLDPRLGREQLLDLLVEALHGVVALVPPLPSAR